MSNTDLPIHTDCNVWLDKLAEAMQSTYAIRNSGVYEKLIFLIMNARLSHNHALYKAVINNGSVTHNGLPPEIVDAVNQLTDYLKEKKL